MINNSLFKGLFLFLVFSGSISVFAQNSSLKSGLDAITAERMKAHVDFLASDELLGRNTPSAGLDTAAAYIVRKFEKYGVQPVNGTYFHPLPLIIRSLGSDNLVEITNNGVTKSLRIKTEFVPFDITANSEVSGNIVFAGYGITAPEYNYDDYAGIDVKGKVVLVMKHEPGEDDTASVFKGRDNTKYSFELTKMKIAREHGAVGMLVITDPLNHQLIIPRGFPWPSLSSILPNDALPMVLSNDEPRIPVVHIGKEVASILFGSVDSLRNIQRTIDSNFKPMSKNFADVSVKIRTSINETPVNTSNIIGIIPGTDPKLKNEYLVIGAHYDHVGFEKNHKEGEDYIINGADDNASGTAGILGVAEAFSKLKEKPKRTVIFIAFAAEEKGLFGSEAYVNNPLVPLENTVAMINLDMISRNHPDSIFFEGAKYTPDLVKIAEAENNFIGFKILKDNEEYMGRSDHANFVKKKVPFLYFHSGEHPDYHTVRDNPDKINPEKVARVTQLVFRTAWYVANDSKRYTLIEKN